MRRSVEWSRSAVATRIDLGTLFYQELDDLWETKFMNRKHQWGHTVAIMCVDLGTIVEQ